MFTLAPVTSILAELWHGRGSTPRLRHARGESDEVQSLADRLATEHAWLSETQALAHIGSWQVDLVTGEVDWSDEMHRIFGTTSATFVPSYEAVLARIHPDDRSGVRAACALAGSATLPTSISHRVVMANGDIRIVEVRARPGIGNDPDHPRVIGTCREVRELRVPAAANDELATVQADALESISDGFYTVDHAWKLIYANPVMERLLGRRRVDLLGRSIWDLFPPGSRSGTIGKLLDRTAAERVPAHDEAIGFNGNWFEIRSYPTSRGIAVHFRDVTERHRATEALRAFALRLEAVQLSERAAIAREIHDVVGQALAVLRLDASRLATLCATNPAARSLAAEMIDVIDDSLRASRSIAMALHPIALDDLGLVGAIEVHVGHVARRADIEAILDLDEAVPELSRSQSTAVYRVLQESLTNVVRHAQATEVRVRLAKSDGNLILEVTDNGIGINASALKTFVSLGLLSMRERAAALEGVVHVSPIEPHGTRVTMTLPLGSTPSEHAGASLR